jgi:hypothetical protein
MDALTLSRLTGITRIELGFEEIAIRILLAFALGLLTALAYRATHKSYSFSYNMVVAIILISMLVSMVLMVIDNSLARAFGLVGALAIIRFRTPIKDIRDIIFLFAGVASGISCGAGAFMIAGVGVVSINIIALLLYWTKFGGSVQSDSYLVKILVSNDDQSEETFDIPMKRYCVAFSLIEMLKGKDVPDEYIFSLKPIDDESLSKLTNELIQLMGVQRVNVLSALHNMDMQ